MRITHQRDSADCGPASLVMIARRFGRHIPIERARHACDTVRSGSTLAGIAKGAASVGLSARVVKEISRHLGAHNE